MPYRYRVIPSQRLGILTLHGAISGETIIEATAAMSDNEAWSPDFARLTDASEVTHLDMGLDHVHTLSRLLLEGRGRAARGAIVTTGDVHETMAKVFKMVFRKDRPVEIFRTIDEALRWLGKDLTAERRSHGDEPPHAGPHD